MSLLLKISGGTFYEIQTDIYIANSSFAEAYKLNTDLRSSDLYNNCTKLIFKPSLCRQLI